MTRLTISPRYTDYTSGAKAKEAFLTGTDFTSLGMGNSGLAVSVTDCQREGITDVTIRYKKSTQITTCAVPPATAETEAKWDRDATDAYHAKIAD